MRTGPAEPVRSAGDAGVGWVKALDRSMPFVVNLATQGKNRQERSISRSQVLKVSGPVREYAPELLAWMVEQIESCVRAGWLRDV